MANKTMIAHSIHLSVFSYPEDDYEKIYAGFVSLLPFDLEKEKLKLDKQSAEGFNDRKIIVLKLDLIKQKHINEFLTSIAKRLSEDQRKLIAEQKESRVDEEVYFFMRFDKEKIIDEQKLWLTDKGNCYHIKMSLAAFPRKKETGLKLIDAFLALGS
jgi:RNA binding exosome subunit